MKKLIIAALAIAAATTMYAQGTVKMTSANAVTYGDSCGALAGEKIGADFTGALMYEGNVIATEPFTVSSKGVPTGKMKGGLVDTTLPAGATVSGSGLRKAGGARRPGWRPPPRRGSSPGRCGRSGNG